MTDEFLTKGLRNDRYLKALRLIDEFENEIEARLREVGQQMIAAQSDLFEANIKGNLRTRQTPSKGLAFMRVHYPMIKEQASGSDKTQKLNVHLYWLNPAQYDRTDIDGALRAFGYKIKNATQAADDRVANKTLQHDWQLQTSGNPWDSNITFYRHVSSAAEIKETSDTLVDHFSTFGGEYAMTSGE